jgi:hypothetical protein
MEKTLEQAEQEFQEWLKTVKIPEERYYAAFDDRGYLLEISSVYAQGKIEIDKEIALDIHTGQTNLKSYKVDIETLTLEKNTDLVFNSLVRIDDILHRVVEKKWSKIEKSDVYIQYDPVNSSLIFSANNKHRNFIWSGDTVLLFLITGYNDPNVLKETVQMTVGDILENKIKIKIKTSGKFSIYTRRVFKDYIFEVL